MRLLPGVLNDDDSAVQDSFNLALSGLLDSLHYTRPEVYDGEAVPAPLLSGSSREHRPLAARTIPAPRRPRGAPT